MARNKEERLLKPKIIIEDTECGPAMLALTPGQRALVYCYVHLGCSGAEAARQAGYAHGKVVGSAILREPGVNAAVIEESRKVLCRHGPKSIATLVAIRDDKTQRGADRIKAAITLLDRAGLNAVSEHHLLVEHKLSEEQQDARILQLCGELGIPPVEARKLLIDPSKVVDAEFEEVKPKLSPEERALKDHRNALERQRRKLTPEQLANRKEAYRLDHKAKMKQRRADAIDTLKAAELGLTLDEYRSAIPEQLVPALPAPLANEAGHTSDENPLEDDDFSFDPERDEP